MIFVNFKTYEKGTGADALALVKILEEVSKSSGVKIIPVLQAADIKEAMGVTSLPIWNQNIDPIEFGAHTGSILAEAVKEDGAEGTFLNHSEHKFEKFEDLDSALKRAHEVDLKTLVFAGDIVELKKVVGLKPTFVSYEPPELVGSKTTSVSEAKPEIIREAVEITKNQGLPLIIGAGIKSQKDIKTGLFLGAAGFAVASSIVASKNPRDEILKLTQGYK